MSDGLKGWQEALEKITPQKMTVERALDQLKYDQSDITKGKAIEFLRQHIAKLEADARRYRWLRDECAGGSFWLSERPMRWLNVDEPAPEWDQAIDRAMGEK